MKLYTKALLAGTFLSAVSAAAIIFFTGNIAHQSVVSDWANEAGKEIRERSPLFVQAFKEGTEVGLLKILQNVQQRTGANYVAAISLQGRIVAHTNVSKTGWTENSLAFTEAVQSREERFNETVWDGKPALDIYVPIDARSAFINGEDFLLGSGARRSDSLVGVIVTSVSLERAMAMEDEIGKKVLWVVCVTFFFAIVLAFFLLRRALRPIRLLSEAARQIGGGKLGSTIPVVSGDEIGELTGTFNQMSEALAKTTVSKDQLQHSEKLLSTVISSLSEAIFIISAIDLRIISSNTAAQDIFGYSAAELAGQPIQKLFVNEETYGYFKGKLSANRWEERHFEMDYELKRQSGENFAAELFIKPIEQSRGVIENCVFVVRDISARKKAEEARVRLSQAVEQAAEGVVITNVEGNITYINPAFEQVSGYGRNELIGQNPRIFKSGKHPKEFYEDMWNTVLRGDIWRGRTINRRKDGKLFEEESVISPVRDAAGRIVNFVAVKRDISKQVELEQQLMQSQKMEVVGRLAGGVAHDFNNLLTSILGFAQMALDQSDPKSLMAEDMKEILKAGERAAALTQQLLQFSRRQVIEPKILEVGALVADTDKMLKRLIGEDINLKILNDGSHWHVKIDPNQFGQVLVNLAVNARDAMPQGGLLAMQVASQRVEEKISYQNEHIEPGDYAVINVSDTGHGMPADVMEHLFEPFFTTKPKGKGTGLGLATVYGVVKQNKGYMTVYSEVGIGTTFRIYLPRQEESNSSAASTEKQQDASGSETILLVEDERMVRNMAQRALESRGYKVTMCASGAEAISFLEKAEGTPIQLLLTDVVMPEMSGPALAKKAQQIRPGIKVMFMSGYTDEMIAAHGILEEGTHFLQKPFTPLSLAKKVREVLG